MSNSALDTGHPGEYHRPVMARETVGYLRVGTGLYVDATVGGGGHSAMILERLQVGMLVGIDQDPDALARARARFASHPDLRLVHGSFARLAACLSVASQDTEKIAGIVFDLGMSRHQATSPQRGFSYQANGPLDMRFDQNSDRPTARDVIRRSSERELEAILKTLGEERFYRRISRRIFRFRASLRTTSDLAEVVRASVPRRFEEKALARVFQALRIRVNGELESLKDGLRQAVERLAAGGRIVVLAYHSLEDRIAKQLFREFAEHGLLEILTKKPLRPSPEEVRLNPSARSARLRAAERRS